LPATPRGLQDTRGHHQYPEGGGGCIGIAQGPRQQGRRIV